MHAFHRSLVAIMLAAVLLAAGGCKSLQVEATFKEADQPTATAQPAATLSSSTATAVPPTAQPTNPPLPPTPVPTATPPPATVDTDAPVQVVLDYLQAINDRSFDHAYKSWMDDGRASGQTLEQFTQGYAKTVQVTAQLGTPTVQIVGANAFVDVPATLMAVVNDDSAAQGQRVQHFQGSYTLQVSSHAWRISSAKMAEVAGDGAAPKDRSDPAVLLQNYVDAINRHEYARAYTYWAKLGAASGQTFAEFRQGFATTGKVEIQLGQAQSQGAAGSIYADVPALIVATQADGSVRTYCGTYTLRRLNVPPFDQFGWRIEQASMAQAANVQLGSAVAQRLLANGCKP